MNERVFDLFTVDNVKSYAKACIDVCDMLEILVEENYKTLIIPSRGAYPFVSWALNYEYMSRDIVGFPPKRFHHQINQWLLPFTADWGDEQIDVGSQKIRLFWTKIIADTFDSKKSIYTQLYENIVQDIGNYLTVNTDDLILKREKKEDKRFIFIDTAISGRAICEILQGFKDNNLNDYYVILIVDDDGNGLKDKYLKVINEEIQKNKLYLIKVKNIFSEDTSPLFNDGISSIVFPNLASKLYNSNLDFGVDKCVGGGIWFTDSLSQLKFDGSSLNGIRGVVASFLSSGLNEFIYEEREDNYFCDDFFMDFNNKIIGRAQNINLFDKETTKRLVYDRIKKRNSKIVDEKLVDVSSSHVIRINFTEKYLDDFVRRFRKSF